MSDFSISQVQRQRLLAGQYSPLVFQGVLEPDDSRERLPYGCEPGARYVLAWKQAQATVLDEDTGEVAIMPHHPTWFITVTAVEGGPRRPRQLADRPWVVRFSVTDVRDTDVFLRPGGGDSSVDLLAAGAKPPGAWLDVRAKTISEFDHQRRLAKHAEELRERSRAKRARRAA